MKYKLYTREVGGDKLLEEPGDGPGQFYEAQSLEEAEAKCRGDVENFNATLKPGEKEREFVRVESEDDWCAAHPEAMATAEAIMDFFFMHWISDDDVNRLYPAASRVLRTIGMVMECFHGERSKHKRDLAVQKLEEWLRKKDCEFEANIVAGQEGLNRNFQEYADELRDALCGYLPAAKLRIMYHENGRWDKRGTTGTP